MKKVLQFVMLLFFITPCLQLNGQEGSDVPRTEEYAILNLSYFHKKYVKTLYIGAEPVVSKTINGKKREMENMYDFPPITEEMGWLNEKGFTLFSVNTHVFPYAEMNGGTLQYVFVFKKILDPLIPK